MRIEVSRREQEIMQMATKMKTLVNILNIVLFLPNHVYSILTYLGLVFFFQTI